MSILCSFCLPLADNSNAMSIVAIYNNFPLLLFKFAVSSMCVFIFQSLQVSNCSPFTFFLKSEIGFLKGTNLKPEKRTWQIIYCKSAASSDIYTHTQGLYYALLSQPVNLLPAIGPLIAHTNSGSWA